MKIKYATAQYTGGGIYIYYGQLEDGNFFRACDDWECIEICNTDTSMDAADNYEFYEEHRVNTLFYNQYETFWNEILLWIIRNAPKGNYSSYELENRMLKSSTTEEKPKICGVMFKEGSGDDYSYSSDFYLTEEEESTILQILMNHETEGGSVRGTWKEVIEYIKGE